MNEGQILNFYKHFIYKSGFVGFAGWFYNLDFTKVTRTYVGKRRHFRSFIRTFFIRANK